MTPTLLLRPLALLACGDPEPTVALGGGSNSASGSYSVVYGGYENTVSSAYEYGP